jgi:hypothetical protein
MGCTSSLVFQQILAPSALVSLVMMLLVVV